MPDPDQLRDLLGRHHRRLAHYLRTLLPDAADAEAALRETVLRIRTQESAGRNRAFEEWAEGIARDVAAGRRKAAVRVPFSDDLFRQLADVPRPAAARAEARAGALAESLAQLPPPDRDLVRRRYGMGLTMEQIAATDGRSSAAVVRDLAGVHESLLSAIQAAVPDTAPDPPGGAADLGRMADQLLDGTITDDGRIVFETLLLADVPGQAHYARHAALLTDLAWTLRGAPSLPEPPPDPPGLTRREKVVTAAFVACCTIAFLIIILLLTGLLS
ncbi:MAG TPA: sigma-70 family RNA polymerase sigma factor [Gemmataceae bacterium]|nr:sigma-70 family RNA polymerase sigma factor [Gemmataceae bacterium]